MVHFWTGNGAKVEADLRRARGGDSFEVHFFTRGFHR
jgi:hypothetical protein